MPMIAVNALSYNVFSSSNITAAAAAPLAVSDGGGAVCCGNYPAAYGYSAQFNNLGAGTQGQGYQDGGCSSFQFAVYGPGTQCWKSGGGSRISSLNWFHSQSKRVVKPRATSANDNETETCAPDFFSYPDKEGKTVNIKVEDAAHAEYVARVYERGDFTALAGFEKWE